MSLSSDFNSVLVHFKLIIGINSSDAVLSRSNTSNSFLNEIWKNITYLVVNLKLLIVMFLLKLT